MVRSKSTIAVPPGATIKEQLQDRCMSQKEFAARMNMSEKHISRLINGEVQLTANVALNLELVLGVPAEFWNKLEAQYREKLLRVEIENAMDSDIEIAKGFPYAEMSDRNWVTTAKNDIETVTNLRKFFEVVELGLLNDRTLMKVAYRRFDLAKKNDLSTLAWIQEAKLLSRGVDAGKVDAKKLESSIPDISKILKSQPATLLEDLRDILKPCGVVLVCLPTLKNTPIHAASFADGGRNILCIADAPEDDAFKCSLIHELGHIVLGHLTSDKDITECDERFADAWALNLGL